jgi:hypothetical protein
VITEGYGLILFVVLLLVGGSIWGGLVMGIYLYLANRIFGNHNTEASSSLSCEDYKCFLRMHINADGLTIYPIGIKKVTKNWKMHTNGDTISFTGDLPEIHLIEEPIIIKKN